MDKGDLVPDDITIPMILDALKVHQAHGWLLDGFPRNPVQAESLWRAMQESGLKLDYAVEICLAREDAKNRIMGRRICANDANHPNNIFIEPIRPSGDKCRVCGDALSARSDDQNEAAVNKRHDIYYDEKNGTRAAVEFFKKMAAQGKTRYISLDGKGEINAVREKLLEELRWAENL
jgi:adenylate kinase